MAIFCFSVSFYVLIYRHLLRKLLHFFLRDEQEAILDAKKEHEKAIEKMREKHKKYTESMTSRFNATLKLNAELDARVKDLSVELERRDPVR